MQTLDLKSQEEMERKRAKMLEHQVHNCTEKKRSLACPHWPSVHSYLFFLLLQMSQWHVPSFLQEVGNLLALSVKECVNQ